MLPGEGGHVQTGAEAGITQLSGKEPQHGQPPPETGKQQGSALPWSLQREHIPAFTFLAVRARENTFLLFSTTLWGVLC